MRNVIEFERPDYCVECSTRKSIECYTIYDKPIGYTDLINRLRRNEDIDHILKNNQLSYMKCRKCGKVYIIFWNTENHIPEPLRSDIFYNDFMDNFKK